MGTFAKCTVEDMIRKYGDVATILTEFEGYDVWVLANGTTIRLPTDNSRVSEQEVAILAEVKLGLGSWEYDYWIGEQGV